MCIAETKQAAGPDLTTQCAADAGRGASTALLDHIIGKQHQLQQQQLEALDHLDHLERLEQVYHSPGGECSELYATVLDDGAGSSDHHHPDDHLIDPDCLLTQVSPAAARLPDGRLSNKPFLI